MQDRNGNQGDEYTYELDNRYSPASQFDIYEQRRTTKEPIVKVYGAEHTSIGGALDSRNEMRVITEHIPHRLTNIFYLTYTECLYVCQESLRGCEYLCDHAGPFDVNSDMIGFTENGEAKVWFNDNYGENRPSRPIKTLQSTNNLRVLDRNTEIPNVSQAENLMVK